MTKISQEIPTLVAAVSPWSQEIDHKVDESKTSDDIENRDGNGQYAIDDFIVLVQNAWRHIAEFAGENLQRFGSSVRRVLQ